MRGASCAIQQILGRLFGGDTSTPCANTGRLWILRLGLYELTRPKEQADDWVWLADHTIQLDSIQCLLIVGIRIQQWQKDRHPLEHHDLHFLLLHPGNESTGEFIRDQFIRLVEAIGVPRAILTDGGPNLKRAVSLFREQYPQVAHSGDIMHKAALCLKKILTGDERWDEFLKKSGQTRKHCAKTPLAFLSPPTVPDQARYMNLQGVLKWASDIRRFMKNSTLNDGTHVEPWKVTIEFKWIEDFADSLQQWRRLQEIVEQVVHYIRWEGYHQNATRELEERLNHLRGDLRGDQLIEELIEYVREQSQAARAGERLPGSTECLESLIGKRKRLEGQQSRSGFTRMILGMAASVIKPTYHTIQAALETVRTEDVYTWASVHLGQTVQAKRRLAFAAPADGTKTG